MNRMKYHAIQMFRDAHHDINWNKIVNREGHSMEEEALFWALATYVIHVHDDIDGAGMHLLEKSPKDPLTFKKGDIVELMQRTLIFGLHYAANYYSVLKRILDEDDNLGDF